MIKKLLWFLASAAIFIPLMLLLTNDGILPQWTYKGKVVLENEQDALIFKTALAANEVEIHKINEYSEYPTLVEFNIYTPSNYQFPFGELTSKSRVDIFSGSLLLIMAVSGGYLAATSAIKED